MIPPTYDESTLFLVRDTLEVFLKIVIPILGAGVVVGLTVSILQSVTSIQDQALTFVPKIFAMIVVTVMLLPWIALRLVEFTHSIMRLF